MHTFFVRVGRKENRKMRKFETANCGLCGGEVVDGEPTCWCWEKHVRRERGISGKFELLQYLINKYGDEETVDDVIDGEAFDNAVERLDRWMK